MIAYTIEKSNLGPLGFDSLNFFTNDKVSFTGFEPNEFEVNMFGRLIKRINSLYHSNEPNSLVVSKIRGVYLADLKLLSGSKVSRFSSEGSSLAFVLQDLERKAFFQCI